METWASALHPYALIILSHLYQHVGCIVETHNQGSHSCHVVHVWERDEGDRRHVVEKHNQEILRWRKAGISTCSEWASAPGISERPFVHTQYCILCLYLTEKNSPPRWKQAQVSAAVEAEGVSHVKVNFFPKLFCLPSVRKGWKRDRRFRQTAHFATQEDNLKV